MVPRSGVPRALRGDTSMDDRVAPAAGQSDRKEVDDAVLYP